MRGENYPFDQAAGQLNKFITSGVIGRAQFTLVDFDAIRQHGWGQPNIADRFGGQSCELGWVFAVIGDQILVAGLGRRADQYVLGQARPRKIPCFGQIGDHGFTIGLRCGDARENCLLQDTARGVFAQGGFKIGLLEIVALQDLCIGFAIKFAIKPLEGRDFHHLFEHAFIPRGQAEVGDQLIQSARADHPV